MRVERRSSGEVPLQGGDDVASQDWLILKHAAHRTSLSLAEQPAAVGRSADILPHVTRLAEWVLEQSRGLEPNFTHGIPPLPIGVIIDAYWRHLLEELQIAGEKIGVAGSVRLMQALDRVADRLDSDPSHRFVSRFLGSAGLEALVDVAHDMRSPLASIVLLVETMRAGKSGPTTGIQERQLALIYGATVGLSLMASDVIDLAREEERIAGSRPTPFSVRDVMEAVREIVQPIAEEKQLELRLESSIPDWRLGYPTALHRVLLNLTTNALKFTDAGFVEVAVTQSTRSQLLFTVTDSGRGIPEQLLAGMFDAFRPEEGGGKLRFSSSGLGLAICRKFVRFMGGELSAVNLEQGSRFQFTIDLPPAPRF